MPRWKNRMTNNNASNKQKLEIHKKNIKKTARVGNISPALQDWDINNSSE